MNTYQKTVLIIDDTPTSMSVLADALGQAGFRILIAEGGLRALRLLQHATEQAAAEQVYAPDIILLDVNMPGLNGFETCRQIKSIPNIQHIPVLFITAHNESVNKVRGFDVGGADYITKPFDLTEVQARINTHLTLSRLQRQLQRRNDLLDEELRAHRLQLEREISSREQADSVLLELREERNRLLDLSLEQNDQLGELTRSLVAVQSDERKAVVRLLNEQVQEKLSLLHHHLDAMKSNIELWNYQHESEFCPSAIPDLVRSKEILFNVINQVAQLRSDLEQENNLIAKDDPLLLLSAREREVFTLIATGKTNAEIAATLHVAPTTVRTHRARIMQKLEVESAYELMVASHRYYGGPAGGTTGK